MARMSAWLVFAAVFAAVMADDDWLVFAADAASGAAPLDAMEGREDAAGHEWTPAAGRRHWGAVKRHAFGLSMAAARVKQKFVKHCARQADSVERLVEHVVQNGRLGTNVDLQVVRADGELHGIKLKIRKLHSNRAGRASVFSWKGMLELAHGKRHSITALAEGYCTSRQTVRRVTEVRQPCKIIQTYKLR
jgi:hypothetical protein